MDLTVLSQSCMYYLHVFFYSAVLQLDAFDHIRAFLAHHKLLFLWVHFGLSERERSPALSMNEIYTAWECSHHFGYEQNIRSCINRLFEFKSRFVHTGPWKHICEPTTTTQKSTWLKKVRGTNLRFIKSAGDMSLAYFMPMSIALRLMQIKTRLWRTDLVCAHQKWI